MKSKASEWATYQENISGLMSRNEQDELIADLAASEAALSRMRAEGGKILELLAVGKIAEAQDVLQVALDDQSVDMSGPDGPIADGPDGYKQDYDGPDLREAAEALLAAAKELENAADAYSADQAGAPHPLCGLVQPITVKEGDALNRAILGIRSAIADYEGGE